MPIQDTRSRPKKIALVVHAEMDALSRFQSSLSEKGFTVIVSRDLTTSLLAMNQHCFDLAIVSSELKESGDGWPLAAVLRMAFPKARVCVLTATGPDVLTLQTAINHGIRETYELTLPPKEIISSLLTKTKRNRSGEVGTTLQ